MMMHSGCPDKKCEDARMLPHGWRWVPLIDLCDFIRGVTFDKAEAKRVALPGHVPIIRAGNIGQVINTSSDLVWVPADRVSPEQVMRAGDIAICMSSGSPGVVGKTAQLITDWSGSVGAFCGIARPRSRDLVGYLGHWFRSPAYLMWRDGQARGANIQNLRFSQLGNVRVPLPPPDRQKKIVAILNEAMAAAERVRSAIGAQLSAAEALLESYLRAAFEQITPLAIGPDHASAPAGWRWVRLTDVARLESGHTPSRNHPEWWGGDVPWLALPDIRALDGKIVYDTKEHTNEMGIANSSARVLPVGTVCLSRTATVGFVTVMGRPMATSQDFVNWVCGPELYPHFLAFLVRAARADILALGSGAIHKTVYVPTVKSFHVCIPPLDRQKQIAESLSRRMEQAEKIVESLEAQTLAINGLPQTILRRAFSGEL